MAALFAVQFRSSSVRESVLVLNAQGITWPFSFGHVTGFLLPEARAAKQILPVTI